MDNELFDLAVLAASRIPSSGIGTLGEKRIHAALKYYVQPDAEKHEVKLHGFVSDALSDDGVYEIQTRGFYRLARKLPPLLEGGTVTVVYPIIGDKVLYVTDAESGEVTVKKSPRHASAYDVFAELYGIRAFLTSKKLRLRLITLKAEEYRTVKTRVSKKGKKIRRTVASEVVPIRLTDDVTLCSQSDYRLLLPTALPEKFTSKDFAGACKIHRTLAATALLILTDLCVVKRVGKSGNAYVYSVNTDEI